MGHSIVQKIVSNFQHAVQNIFFWNQSVEGRSKTLHVSLGFLTKNYFRLFYFILHVHLFEKTHEKWFITTELNHTPVDILR